MSFNFIATRAAGAKASLRKSAKADPAIESTRAFKIATEAIIGAEALIRDSAPDDIQAQNRAGSLAGKAHEIALYFMALSEWSA